MKDSFKVYGYGEFIPDNYKCRWSITSSTGEAIQVSVEITGDEVS